MLARLSPQVNKMGQPFASQTNYAPLCSIVFKNLTAALMMAAIKRKTENAWPEILRNLWYKNSINFWAMRVLLKAKALDMGKSGLRHAALSCVFLVVRKL